MFFQIDLEKNSSSPEGAVFSRPDVPGSARVKIFFYSEGMSMSNLVDVIINGSGMNYGNQLMKNVPLQFFLAFCTWPFAHEISKQI